MPPPVASTPGTPPGRKRQAPSRSPSPAAPRRPAAAGAGSLNRGPPWLLLLAVVVAAAAVAWRLQLVHQLWDPAALGSARPSSPGARLQVEEWVPSAARPADAGTLTSEKLLPHLRVDESGASERVKEEFTPLVLRRPLLPPPAPSFAGGQAGGASDASRGVVILANGRDPDLCSKAYALVALIRELFHDPTPVAIFHLGRAESFSPAAIGAFTALGNVTVGDLGASTGLPQTQKWAGAAGFLSKPRAAIAGLSRWQSVLLLDADSLLFQPPSAFFKLVAFRQTGLAIWRDYHPCFTSLSPFLLRKMQINSTAFCAATRRQESDSSAVVIGGRAGHAVDDSRCAAAGAAALCEHGGGQRGGSGSGELHAQQLMLGDKDSWAMGAALCGMGVESSVGAHPPGAFALQQQTSSGSIPATNEKVAVAVFNGQLQFDDEGKPLYWNSNGQSARELSRAVTVAAAAATLTQNDLNGKANAKELQYLRTLPPSKSRSSQASAIYRSAKDKPGKVGRVEEEAMTLVKINRGKLLPAPPMAMQVLTLATEAATRLSKMDGISIGSGGRGADADVATEDLLQVVSTMMQRGRRLQHAKRGGSALLELDRAASLACADLAATEAGAVETHSNDRAGQLALCATATHALAGSLSDQGNSAAAARAYRKVLLLIDQYRAATLPSQGNSNVELPEQAVVMVLLAECLAEAGGVDGSTGKGVTEALSLVQRTLVIDPTSIAGRLQRGTLLLREATPPASVKGAAQHKSRVQQAVLDEFDTAIALSEADSVPCAAGHLKRGQLLESWSSDEAGARTTEAHASYAAVLELSPHDEDALAGFKRTASPAAATVPVAPTGSTAPRALVDDAIATSTSTTVPLCDAGEVEVSSSAGNNGITCVACAAGRFDHDSNSATSCVPCRPGYDSPPRSTICLKFNSRCQPGHMEQLPSAAKVATLATQNKGKGLFAKSSRLQLGMQAVTTGQQLACVACPEGRFDNDRSASTPCVPCKPGMYSPPRSIVCVDAPVRSMDRVAANQPINASARRRKT